MTPASPNLGRAGSSPNSPTKPASTTESPVPEEKPATSKTSTWRESTPRGSERRGEFRPLVFLYRMLLGIFLVEAFFLAVTYSGCMDMQKNSGDNIQEICPRLAERSDNLFGVAIATVLSLMPGQAVENFRKKN